MTAWRDYKLDLAPLAYWPFDEAAGATTADDVAGTSDLPIGSSVTLGTTGLFANSAGSFTFPGTTVLTARNIGTLSSRPGTAMTVELWVRIDATPAQHQLAVSIANGTVSNVQNFQVRRNSTGNYLAYWDSVNSWKESLVSLTVGTTYHIAWVVTSTTVSFYINGAASANSPVTLASAPPWTVGNTISVGGAPDSGLQNVAGALDDVTIYPTALSAATIAALATGIPPYYAKTGTAGAGTTTTGVRVGGTSVPNYAVGTYGSGTYGNLNTPGRRTRRRARQPPGLS
jgi:hypothetical protein